MDTKKQLIKNIFVRRFYFLIKKIIATNQKIEAKTTPAIKPEREEATILPTL